MKIWKTIIIPLLMLYMMGCSIQSYPAKEEKVIKSGSDYYYSIQEFIDKGKNKKGVLLKNVSENIYVNRNINLDLDGHSISNKNDKSPTVEIVKNCTIENGKVKGSFKKENSTICINKEAKAVLRNLSVDHKNSVFETIQLYGSLELNGTRVSNDNCNTICTYDGFNTNLHIFNGSEIIGISSYDVITNHGTCVIDDATINSRLGYAIDNWDTLIINNGAELISSSRDKEVIVNEDKATIQINGGSYQGGKQFVLNKGIINSNDKKENKTFENGAANYESKGSYTVVLNTDSPYWEAAFAPGHKYQVKQDGLNIRKEPYNQSESIGTLSRGQVITGGKVVQTQLIDENGNTTTLSEYWVAYNGGFVCICDSDYDYYLVDTLIGPWN